VSEVQKSKKKMFQRIRRSFRRKKASYCINCGHVSRECYHQEYENVDFKETQQPNTFDSKETQQANMFDSKETQQANNEGSKTDDLKWLDLDYRFNVLHHNAVNRVQRQLYQDELRVPRPHSFVYSNDYVELPTYSLPYDCNQVRWI
jgi:hypothetical protein